MPDGLLIWKDNEMDPRAERTLRNLQDAVIALVSAHDLAEISVSRLTGEAGVNRSTFYQHYERVDDVLADALDRLAAESESTLVTIDVRNATGPPTPLIAYLGHISENRELYHRALGPDGSPQAIARLLHRIEDATKRSLTAFGPSGRVPGVPIDVIAAATGGSVLGMIVQWIESSAIAPAEQQAQWMWEFFTAPRTQ